MSKHILIWEDNEDDSIQTFTMDSKESVLITHAVMVVFTAIVILVVSNLRQPELSEEPLDLTAIIMNNMVFNLIVAIVALIISIIMIQVSHEASYAKRLSTIAASCYLFISLLFSVGIMLQYITESDRDYIMAATIFSMIPIVIAPLISLFIVAEYPRSQQIKAPEGNIKHATT